MPVNVSLLRETLAYIKAHPEEWNQRWWRCGTSCCFAGHAALLAGWKWKSEESTYEDHMVKDGRFSYASDCAREELGLSADSSRLFHETNTLKDLERIVEALCLQAEKYATLLPPEARMAGEETSAHV